MKTTSLLPTLLIFLVALFTLYGCGGQEPSPYVPPLPLDPTYPVGPTGAPPVHLLIDGGYGRLDVQIFMDANTDVHLRSFNGTGRVSGNIEMTGPFSCIRGPFDCPANFTSGSIQVHSCNISGYSFSFRISVQSGERTLETYSASLITPPWNPCGGANNPRPYAPRPYSL